MTGLKDKEQEFVQKYYVIAHWKECYKNCGLESTDMIDDDTIKQIWKREDIEHRKLWPSSPIRCITIEKKYHRSKVSLRNDSTLMKPGKS